MKKGSVHIGTSGWHYKHWEGNFYPEGVKGAKQFNHYIKTFDTVEINNSFYRLPAIKTMKQWAMAAPGDFIFAIKASRYITHLKKLDVDGESISLLLSRVDHLGEKAGPVLFQLPPGWNPDLVRLANFIEKLPAHYRYSFEFRNHNWYQDEVYDLLQGRKMAFCIYELAGHQSPEIMTANFVYVRLHGPGKKYEGSYHGNTLHKWARRCNEWTQQGKDVYIYFDNDQAGYAAQNARELKMIITNGSN